MARPEIFVALGSNLGDSERILAEAMDELALLSTTPLLRSSLWRTSPVDCPPGSPDFLNAVVGLNVHPGESPESLLKKLQEIERNFGRRPKQVMNEARSLDLDLISFKGERRNSAQLLLPHPRAHERLFVLAPLAEVAPELVLGGQAISVSVLLEQLMRESNEQIERLP